MPKRPIEILLVEDSPSERLNAVEALENARLLNSLNVVEDGAEAMNYLRGRPPYQDAIRPDLILLDLHLPRKDGREVLAEIKADPLLKSIPVVVLTTSDADAEILSTYHHHVNSYIAKPVDFCRLSEALATMGRYWFEVVTLPPGLEEEAAPGPGRRPTSAGQRHLRLLLIEDSLTDQLIFGHALKEDALPAFEVVWVRSLSEARTRLADGHYDIIVTDLGLPDSEGISTYRSVQSASRGIPIIVLTGLEDGELGHTAVREGAQDYLVKGEMTGRGLRRSIRYAIERAQMETQLRHAQRMEAVGQLAGGIAHDFNNLLTVILGHGHALKNESLSASEAAESVQEILASGQRAADLTRQLLTFSRRQVFNPRVLDLNLMIGDLCRMLRRILGSNITIELQLSGEPMQVRADLGMLEQVLMNLTVNARDAMPEGGKLKLHTGRVRLPAPGSSATLKDVVRLVVTDTGCGMEPETLQRIFEPFFTTKDVGRGTGLGLATVQTIVDQHEGWLSVSSKAGQGTTFAIYLPYQTTPAVSIPAATPDSAPGTGELILVVEDEEPLRDMTVSFLRRKGYRVLEASNASEALILAEEWAERIELLFTDIVMPGGMNGRELAVQLGERLPGLRIVYTSGYSPEFVSPDFKLEDGENFLQKPYPFPRLLSVLKARLCACPTSYPAVARTDECSGRCESGLRV